MHRHLHLIHCIFFIKENLGHMVNILKEAALQDELHISVKRLELPLLLKKINMKNVILLHNIQFSVVFFT